MDTLRILSRSMDLRDRFSWTFVLNQHKRRNIAILEQQHIRYGRLNKILQIFKRENESSH